MFPNTPSDWRPVEAQAPQAATPVSRSGRSTHHRGIAATLASLVAVALFGGLIGVGVDRWATSTFSAPSTDNSTPAATVGSGPRVGPVAAPNGGGQVAQANPAAAADPQQVAIQQVIQKGDDEQAQALANNDPTIMADTSTSAFYQEQAQTNQDLTTNGVTAIKLVNIEWGPITVNGTSATATAFETWTTTYSDGTTEQSRDRNVYTLVQDNGTWKVSADDHPDDAVATGTGTGNPGTGVTPGQGNNPNPGSGTGNPSNPGGRGRGTGNPAPGTQPTQPSQPSQPRQPRGQDTSQNWSGYATSGGTYTSVSGTWTVPAFSAASSAGADAAWVGIGGVDTTDLIQAGTQQSVTGSGSTQYEAWVETLPQASHPVPLSVHPGDSVSVDIVQQPQSPNQWQVSIKNNTTGQSYQVMEHYASSMSSAEWIEEAPSAARGRQLPLDDFGTIAFSQASAVKDGQTVSAGAAGAKPITMVSRNGQPLARPSNLGADGASFSVTRA